MGPSLLSFEAKPYPFSFSVEHTALLVIDMQRDFLLDAGFGDIQGGNLNDVQASIAPTKKLIEACRAAGMSIFHTREGHKPDLSDCPSSKLYRQRAAPNNTAHSLSIGDQGPLGRLLTRGEHGHDIVDSLQPLPGEVVIDKPGKGAFWNTSLMHDLKARAITHLIVSGVTTECCFATTIREANDRGFECCGIEEATSGYNDNNFKKSTLDMIYWSQGLFGYVGNLQPLIDALAPVSYIKPAASTPPQTPPAFDGDLSLPSLQRAYKNGMSPVTLVEAIYNKIEAYKAIDSAVWIHLVSRDDALQAAAGLAAKYPDRTTLPPLFGIPFSVKDSIDVQGVPTTTACPPMAFVPSTSAAVFDKVMAHGGLFIGKVNLDQLATGLSGCRSPYGITHSVYNPAYISGGSSSGSAVSVGAGLVTFSLATDTAGSGRVPAGFNGIVGYKPTRGTITFRGVTPACLSLDCIALSTRSVADARLLYNLLEGYDDLDPYAKPVVGAFERHVNSIGPPAASFKFGIPPPEALACCSRPARRMFNEAVAKLQRIGGVLTPCDWTPFHKAGQLLYEGTFVSERLATLPDDFFERHRGALHPVIQQLMDAVVARGSSAVQAYRDLQAKALYTRQAARVFGYSAAGVDVIVVPTAPVHWTIEEVLADPIKKNSVLGEFTHCGNVLDLCAAAVPAGMYPVAELSGKSEDEGELPFSITFLSGSRLDAEMLEIARRFEVDAS